jgi:hypothetical protein
MEFIIKHKRYKGDLQAVERIKNNSICAIDNGKIRSIKEDESLKDLEMVYVENWERVDRNNTYIKQGEYVRYIPVIECLKTK